MIYIFKIQVCKELLVKKYFILEFKLCLKLLHKKFFFHSLSFLSI
jgi:hypothetical protein